jgi:leucyl-tRNA synthetase
MHRKFDHKAIESKWQDSWQESGLYKTDSTSNKPKCFVLDMFPYPSGEGLHVGHPKGYIATDIYSRFKRMTGHEVLHPMGWDAFGLPAENYAITNKVHPEVAVAKNVATFKSQLAKLGFDYDWGREVNTTDPAFYKWTQWIFIQLLKKGLAFESHEPINWCPGCQTGLANEDLESDGTCERCDSVVEQKPMRQWVLNIRAYADRMIEDLDTLEWPEHIKEAQRNWIGRSEGAEIDFKLSVDEIVSVFTTRPDTLYGVTYMVLAPEHELVINHRVAITNWNEVETYIKEAANKKEMDRLDDTKEKTGVKLEGVTAINPANGEVIPVYIADYVLGSYGTGAIMAVPAHDERDFAFATKFGIEITQVVVPCADDKNNPPQAGLEEVKRDTVIVHLKDRSTGKFALLDWHGSLEGISTAIMGGVEEGQTPKEAVIAEAQEEASLQNIQITKELNWVTAAKYCASHKNQNRCAHSYVFLAEIDNLDNQGEILEAEQKLHTLVWVDEQEVLKHLTPDHQKMVWELLNEEQVLTGQGYLMNSGEFDGMDSEEAKTAIVEKVGGRMTTTYKIKDWVFSRQRYWGEPIPVVHAADGTVYAIAQDQLPVTLPAVDHYEPTGDGQSPLAKIDDWVNVTGYLNESRDFVVSNNAPDDQELIVAKRETNTMPQWAGSSWYYLRYIDPTNSEALIDPEKEKEWQPVDVYVGGDHAVRHLIYARFWHKFLYDEGVVSTLEPFQRLEFLGFILASDGRKMSKRWGNVINPDDIVELVGADTLRVYEMFMGPFENTIAWSQDGLVGARRFLERVNGLNEHVIDGDVVESVDTIRQLHKTIKKVSEDIEGFKFNTAVSTMMIFINTAEKEGLSLVSYAAFLRLLAPFAPHLSEELWRDSGNTVSIHKAGFPDYDASLAADTEITIGVQINGKMRGEITVTPETDEAAATELAHNNDILKAKLAEGTIVRTIYVPGRILNFIVT